MRRELEAKQGREGREGIIKGKLAQLSLFETQEFSLHVSSLRKQET